MTFNQLESEWQQHGLTDLEELLSPAESAELAPLRAEHRRTTWLAGRKLLRLLLLKERNIDPAAISIQTRNASGQGIRPQISQDGNILPGCFSLSHSDHHIAAAWTENTGETVGIDLITPGNITPRQFDWAMNDSEKQLVQSQTNPQKAASEIWAFKEATYKAANQNIEGFNPQQITVQQDETGSWSAIYCDEDLRQWGEWTLQNVDDDLLAMVTLNR
ncbi:4'-phosphopantetheinyl transferase family protein [Polystyrenella longa]|nr:4'-phosphopantetheinyl transferase superfamily protein [Polystyrenella longa]